MVDGVPHCLHGHPMTGDNVYTKTGGRPICHTCHLAAQKKAYDKRKLLYGKGE
jgi:hypothetical protein